MYSTKNGSSMKYKPFKGMGGKDCAERIRLILPGPIKDSLIHN